MEKVGPRATPVPAFRCWEPVWSAPVPVLWPAVRVAFGPVMRILSCVATGDSGRLTIAKVLPSQIDQYAVLSGKSSMKKIPITKAGHAALSDELRQLKSVDRPAIIQAIAEAREHGDLSENAEYHAAREKQGFTEARIKELENILGQADVIDPSGQSGPIVRFGATVRLKDEETDEESVYQIVGEPEADIRSGKLNLRSPLARAMVGKRTEDSVEVRTPGGEKCYEIVSVEYV